MGIDPGSNCTGFGIVEEVNGNLQAIHWSSVRSSPKDEFPQRLKRIYDELVLAIKKFKPDVVVVEDLFYATNVKTVIKYQPFLLRYHNTFYSVSKKYVKGPKMPVYKMSHLHEMWLDK